MTRAIVLAAMMGINALICAPAVHADPVVTDHGTLIVDMSDCPVIGWNVYTDRSGNAYARYCAEMSK